MMSNRARALLERAADAAFVSGDDTTALRLYLAATAEWCNIGQRTDALRCAIAARRIKNSLSLENPIITTGVEIE